MIVPEGSRNSLGGISTIVTAFLVLAGCAVQGPAPVDPNLAAREALSQRCDKDLALAAELQQELEETAPPYTVTRVLKPYNRFDMLLLELWVDNQLYEAVHPDREYREIAEACKARLAEFWGRVELSQPLYKVISQVDLGDANAHTRRYVERILEGFERSGVDRDEATRERLAVLNAELEELGQTFDRNLREDTRYLVLDSVDELAGLPEDYIANHPPGEDGKIRISTAYPDYIPLMTYAHLPGVRRDMARIAANRGWPANEEVFRGILERRHELAQLLGYDSYADFVTANKMSGSGAAVSKFIDNLADRAEPAARRDYQRLLERKRKIEPGATEVFGWERSYLMELIRREEYAVDSAEIRSYFGYADTRDAMFSLTQRLFGLTVHPWETQVWHPDVEAYELREGQQVLGRFYLDMHPRPDKHDHVSHFPLQPGVANRQVPMSALVTNFPGRDDPDARMEHDDVVSFAHEFGHLLHRLMSGHFEWAGLVGNERDFSEAPSQMLEEWAWDPGFLHSFARSREGEPIPYELVERMRDARYFGKPLSVRSQLYLAGMSFNYHNYNPAGIDLDELMIEMKNQYSMFSHMEGTHSWANFGHLVGYSALYYSYLWSEVIAADMFSRFEREGLFDADTADHYRATILGAGATKPASELVSDFLGRPFNSEAFSRRLTGG